MTQTEFGEMLGVKLRTVQDWEAGKHNMPKTAQLLLSKIMDDTESVQSKNDYQSFSGYTSKLEKRVLTLESQVSYLLSLAPGQMTTQEMQQIELRNKARIAKYG